MIEMNHILIKFQKRNKNYGENLEKAFKVEIVKTNFRKLRVKNAWKSRSAHNCTEIIDSYCLALLTLVCSK